LNPAILRIKPPATGAFNLSIFKGENMIGFDQIEEVTIQCPPESWKQALLNQDIGLFDIPDEVVQTAMLEGIRRYYKQEEYACVAASADL
jgi:hypothetical protein